MLRLTLAGLLVVVSAAVGFAQDKKEDKKDTPPKNLHPLEKGAKWEYAANYTGVKSDLVNEVKEVSEPKKGERAVATVAVGEKLSADEKGVYRHESGTNVFDPPLLIAQHGEKAEGKWSRKVKLEGEEVTLEFEQKAAEKVKVPAGEFSAVVVVQTMKNSKGMTQAVVTTWYAEGVGVVKSTMQEPAFSLELKKFTPAK